MMRYADLAEMILLCIVLAVIGVASFYGARWQWGRIDAHSRVIIRNLVIVADLFAGLALGRILFSWFSDLAIDSLELLADAEGLTAVHAVASQPV